MPFTEHEIGKGTIGYAGEDPDYWWRKSALWRPRRTAITVVVLLLGLLLLAFAASPLAARHAQAKVLTRTLVPSRGPHDPRGTYTRLEVRVLHEGAVATTTVLAPPEAMVDDADRPGQVVTVTTRGRGAASVLGADDVLWPWVFGVLLVLVAAGRYLWDRRTADRLHYFR